MEALVVGGNIDPPKNSKIAQILAGHLKAASFQGYLPKDIRDRDLVVWMPNISNEKSKDYPKKDRGCVLVCSKVMREGYTRIDSVTRIFKMHGNAVIEIYPAYDGMTVTYEFILVDALGNVWGERTPDLKELADSIKRFYTWTKGSRRRSLTQGPSLILEPEMGEYYRFIQLNQKLALECADRCGNRFFGNYSTRCTKLFPSYRLSNELYAFSARNTDKKYITTEDMVVCDQDFYYSDRKPSVDTPVQLEVYDNFPSINYMIHGHGFIEGVEFTENYYPCGDMREAGEVLEILSRDWNGDVCAINLKNHGFLIVSSNLEEMDKNWRFYA